MRDALPRAAFVSAILALLLLGSTLASSSLQTRPSASVSGGATTPAAYGPSPPTPNPADVGQPNPPPLAGPTPFFVARQRGMTTDFDANGSLPSPGATLTNFSWDFGDGGTGYGVVVSHTYAAPSRYNASLAVTDSSYATTSTTRFVSANTTTVDILMDRFFVSDCPYRPLWQLRYRTYGDMLLSPQPPCTDFYPWVLYSSTPETNPSRIYTLYHFDARVTNHRGYSVAQPVFLPVLDPSTSPAPSSYVYLNYTFDYLDNASIAYWDSTAWPVSPKYSDGFGFLVRGTVTMDLQESRRIFGVRGSTPAQAQAWWYANTKYGAPTGPLESNYSLWLDRQGNVAYDIYNGFFWFFESDITDLNATVAPDGTTTVRTFLDGWGYDVLQARWFYWGAQNYTRAVNTPYGQYPPRGWMPFENCWCENATVNATLRSSLDIEFQGTTEYSLEAVGNPGIDGVLGTSDDLPSWSYGPELMDYVPPLGSGLPGASVYPNSELRWYQTYTDTITTPGSWGYGSAFEYTKVPTRWNLSLGNTLTLLLPRGNVLWYDPAHSYWNPTARIGNYTTFLAPATLRSVEPAGTYWTYDSRGNVVSIAAPSSFGWGASGLPLASAPTIEMGPYVADTTPPRTTATILGTGGTGGWYNRSPLLVSLESTDAGSGVAFIRYRVDGGPWTPYVAPFQVAGEGRHAVDFYATDLEGNVEAQQTASVRIDVTPPTVSGLAPTGLVHQASVYITWNGSDSLSGIADYVVVLDGLSHDAGTTPSYGVALLDGTHTLTVQARDLAGNLAASTATFQVDTNVFSFTGPVYGVPTILVIVAVAAVSYVMWRRRRRPSAPSAVPPESGPTPPPSPPPPGS